MHRKVFALLLQVDQSPFLVTVCSQRSWALVKAFASIVRERQFEAVGLLDAFITEDCNCRCDYCFIHGKRPKRMSEELVRATVDFLLLKSRHLRRVELLFFGGEPLMAFDLMKLTVDYGNWRATCMGKLPDPFGCPTGANAR